MTKPGACLRASEVKPKLDRFLIASRGGEKNISKAWWLNYNKEALKDFLDKHGKIMHGGSIVDATIVAAPTSAKNAQKQRGPEMHQVKKGNEWYSGERPAAALAAFSRFCLTPKTHYVIIFILFSRDHELVHALTGAVGAFKPLSISTNDCKIPKWLLTGLGVLGIGAGMAVTMHAAARVCLGIIGLILLPLAVLVGFFMF